MAITMASICRRPTFVCTCVPRLTLENHRYSESGNRSGARYLADVRALIASQGLPFQCDQPTEALGNCFPYAIVQQLHRPEVRATLSPDLTMISENYHHLRSAVPDFVTNISPASEYFDLVTRYI